MWQLKRRYEIYTHLHYLRSLGAYGYKKQKQETHLLNNDIKLKTCDLKTKTNPQPKVVSWGDSPPAGK